MAKRAMKHLSAAGEAAELIDLRMQPIPFCDGHEASSAPAARALAERVREADAVILAVPIYNFDANAVAKNLIELTGRAWTEKVVGFLCAAGGRGSYMSIMPLANSLMLDFRCLIVPRFVFATDANFDEDGRPDGGTDGRIAQLCGEVARIAGALRAAEVAK